MEVGWLPDVDGVQELKARRDQEVLTRVAVGGVGRQDDFADKFWLGVVDFDLICLATRVTPYIHGHVNCAFDEDRMMERDVGKENLKCRYESFCRQDVIRSLR
ncbi:hypothetical protein [Micromonospora sp. ATA51]|uniref:hypothetical protein n=1 Tax=Micromonospora sp. ATA51 TaxID=2806098 RepID=UPI001A47EDAC|nr:hypothetical protein [Micromonospora sp. ATA51]MBM0225520.1 hypothetical protein [Micromonospora sp. ATA51]